MTQNALVARNNEAYVLGKGSLMILCGLLCGQVGAILEFDGIWSPFQKICSEDELLLYF